jgi:hypothetical protein
VIFLAHVNADDIIDQRALYEHELREWQDIQSNLLEEQTRLWLLTPHQLLDLIDAMRAYLFSSRPDSALQTLLSYLRCMFPDARAPPARPAPPAGPVPLEGPGPLPSICPEQRIWAALRSSAVDFLGAEGLGSAAEVTIHTVAHMVTSVVAHLEHAGAVDEVDEYTSSASYMPVLLRCADRSPDWTFHTLVEAMQGLWLPRCERALSGWVLLLVFGWRQLLRSLSG